MYLEELNKHDAAAEAFRESDGRAYLAALAELMETLKGKRS